VLRLVEDDTAAVRERYGALRGQKLSSPGS
jgi:hypothetical protein